jgi:hypothetical protein
MKAQKMNIGRALWRLLIWLLKLAFRIFMLLLWAASSVAEIILHNLNIYLKKFNSK